MAAERRRVGFGKRIVFRGRNLGADDVERIQCIVDRHREETRQEIAQRVSRRFGWREPGGKWAVSSCRLLLVRLERRALITLPAPRRTGNFFERRRAAAESAPQAGLVAETSAAAELVEVDAPLEVRPLLPGERDAWRQDMARWHYLGDCNLVGESLRYVALVGPMAFAFVRANKIRLSAAA